MNFASRLIPDSSTSSTSYSQDPQHTRPALQTANQANPIAMQANFFTILLTVCIYANSIDLLKDFLTKMQYQYSLCMWQLNLSVMLGYQRDKAEFKVQRNDWGSPLLVSLQYTIMCCFLAPKESLKNDLMNKIS